jgi:hypothetical protein
MPWNTLQQLGARPRSGKRRLASTPYIRFDVIHRSGVKPPAILAALVYIKGAEGRLFI